MALTLLLDNFNTVYEFSGFYSGIEPKTKMASTLARHQTTNLKVEIASRQRLTHNSYSTISV